MSASETRYALDCGSRRPPGVAAASPLAVALFIAGCAGPTTTPPGASFTARDSAGVQIAENSGEPPITLTVDGPPRLDIGVAEGDPMLQLSRVVGAVFTGAGELVIANAGTSELRFFDASGSFVRTIGRQGEGPGEFTALGSIFVRGDSLVAYDRRTLRFTIFDREGELVGTTPPGDTFVGLLGDGTLISYGVTTRGMPDPGSVTRSSGILLRHPPDGSQPDTIVRFAMNDRYVHTEIPGFSERMFGRTTELVFGDDGVLIADNDRYELREVRVNGSVARLTRWDRPNRPVTSVEVDAYLERAAARYGDDPRAEMFGQTLRDQPPPAMMPAFGRSGLIRTARPAVFRSAAGNLWVLEYVAFPDDPETWQVFDQEGRLRGAVVLPHGVEITSVGAGGLVAVRRDDLDVEHVLVFDFAAPWPAKR
ncbi:MAG: 6-bladed beta-propeller [Gemmatimonadota bacterium]